MSRDALLGSRGRLQAARIDPDRPLGIHEPKHAGDCGWDLEALEDVTIPPMQTRDVPINAKLSIPPGVWGLMLARSSIAKRHLAVEAGVIDNGYRGPLFVVLRNMQLPATIDVVHGASGLAAPGSRIWHEQSIKIKAGERVAQMVFYRDMPLWLSEIEEVSENTSRGAAGFGSTGR